MDDSVCRIAAVQPVDARLHGGKVAVRIRNKPDPTRPGPYINSPGHQLVSKLSGWKFRKINAASRVIFEEPLF